MVAYRQVSDDSFKESGVLGLTVRCTWTHSPNTQDGQSWYLGLPAMYMV